MLTSEDHRQLAERCIRLAKECTKPSVAEYLMTLAANYLERAEQALILREPATAVGRQHIKIVQKESTVLRRPSVRATRTIGMWKPHPGELEAADLSPALPDETLTACGFGTERTYRGKLAMPLSGAKRTSASEYTR